jgi:hypothetical protein
VVFAEPDPHPDPAGVRVVLEPTVRSAGLTAAVTAAVRSDGTFDIAGVLPGSYRLLATLAGRASTQNAWTLRSSVLLGQQTLDRAVRLDSQTVVVDAVVTFSDRMADVSGTIAPPGAAGARVILFPTDPALCDPDAPRIRSVVAAENGTYLFRGVLPGSYFVAVTDNPEPEAWRDEEFLRGLAASAARVDVVDGRSVIHNLERRR